MLENNALDKTNIHNIPIVGRIANFICDVRFKTQFIKKCIYKINQD